MQKFSANDLSLPMPFLLKIGQSKFPLWHNPVKSQKYCASQIRVVIRYHYDISGLVPETSFCGETSGGIAKCQLITLIQK